MTTESVGTWIAYWREAETGKKIKYSLGDFETLPQSERYAAANKAADVWLAERGTGARTDVRTVRDACADYVKHTREAKGETAATDVEARFKRHVYSKKDLADCDLGRLTAHRLELWRKGLKKTAVKVNRAKDAPAVTRPRSASSVNRDCTALRAALNRAHRLGCVPSDVAWLEELKPTKNADGRRDVFLSRDERRALIEVAAPDIAAYVKGLSLVPLRPGALAALTAKSFDKRLGVLVIGKDKNGADRRIKLPAATSTFFAGMVADKLPTAPLFARADGSAWDRFAWRNAINDAVELAGLPKATSAYALRHSTITDLVTGGLDLMTVAQISGTSVAMIERHYAHLQRDRAAEALAGLAL